MVEVGDAVELVAERTEEIENIFAAHNGNEGATGVGAGQ